MVNSLEIDSLQFYLEIPLQQVRFGEVQGLFRNLSEFSFVWKASDPVEDNNRHDVLLLESDFQP